MTLTLSPRLPAPCARRVPRIAAGRRSAARLRALTAHAHGLGGNETAEEPRRSASTMRLNAVAAPERAAAPAGPAGGDDGGDVENLVIIGSGPAGYTAAIYASRANLAPVLFEGYSRGGVPGGQLMSTTEVENFPGFPDGITGPDLMARMRRQAVRWGAELITEDVDDVDLSRRPFVVRSGDRVVRAHAIIVATGATAMRLGLPSESRFWGAGISACAICDGASPLYKGANVAVVGGGDSAVEEAVYLTKYAAHVDLLVRGAALRASKAMADRVSGPGAHPRVTVRLNTAVVDAVGDADGRLVGLRVRDGVTGVEAPAPLPVRGLFYGIGHTPNSGFLRGQVAVDAAGYVVVTPGGVSTSVPGVFSAGDLHDHEWRQAITAAGSGCMAALAAERYLTSQAMLIDKTARVVAAAAAAAAAAATAAAATAAETDGGDGGDSDSTPAVLSFDIASPRHKGQYALRRLYHESDGLIGVLYSAPTCGPCRMLKPILARVVDGAAGGVGAGGTPPLHWVEIDIQEDPEIAEAAGVTGTPTVHFFKRKERVAVLAGVKPKGEYRAVIEAHLQGAGSLAAAGKA